MSRCAAIADADSAPPEGPGQFTLYGPSRRAKIA
jgi:hypothetical protein